MTDPFPDLLDASGAPQGPDGLLRRALDPADPRLSVVGWKARRLKASVLPGDLILRERPGGGHAAIGVVCGPLRPRTGGQASATTPGRGGRFVQAVLPDGSLAPKQIAGADGFLLKDIVLVRPSAVAEAVAAPSRPTIRRGSSGPAVAAAQGKLNRVDASEKAQGRRGLDRCPLEADGKFGPATQAATLSFQRLAFPGRWQEWDGVIGPKTWSMLEAFAPDAPPEIPPYVPPKAPPIIPVVDRPLDPGRWDAILKAAASSSTSVRSGNAVRPLIDGREAYLRMADDIAAASGESDYVYLLGWSYFDAFDMGGGNRMRDLLQRASDRGVQVRAMLWAKPPAVNLIEVVRIDRLPNGAAIRDDETPNKTIASTRRLQAALLAAGIAPEIIPLILPMIVPDLIRLTGSHHQKVLVVKRGGTLVAYCGGLDINPDRINVVSAGKGEPLHDAHCRIVGPSAWDLLDTFIRRWRHHPDSPAKDAAKGALRGATEPVPAPLTRPSREDAPFGGTTSVAIARTFTPVHAVATTPREREIRALLLAGIRGASRFIYIEDQYLIDLEAAAALNAAVPNIQHLTIVIPGNPLMGGLPFAAEYRRDFVETVLRRLSPSDAAKVGVFQLSSSPAPPPVVGDHTYVHSKTWVFDDELAVIGSANCNRRGWQHDSEVDAFIFDDPAPATTALAMRSEAAESAMTVPGFAQRYRMALWAHHLGVPASAVADGVASVGLWGATPPPTTRALPFNHVLPPGRIQTIRDQAARALRAIIDPVP